ncbi:unnamed protein product [Calypogeia fissa]
MTGRRRRVSASSGQGAIIGPVAAGKRPLSAIAQQNNISDFGQLKNGVEVQLQALKTYIDQQHASVVKLIDAQSSKLKKRWKNETQTLTATGEAADTDWKNFLADHEEDAQEHQNSMDITFSKLEASAAHFSKTCIPELLKSVEMSVETMKNRYARSAKSARRLSASERITAKFSTDIEGE